MHVLCHDILPFRQTYQDYLLMSKAISELLWMPLRLKSFKCFWPRTERQKAVTGEFIDLVCGGGEFTELANIVVSSYKSSQMSTYILQQGMDFGSGEVNMIQVCV